jgi:hypothetical protein
VHAFFKDRGASILSSHLAERFGAEVHEGTLVQRDNTWLRASDLYLAFLPMRGAEPYRTDGTFVEIGLAIGTGKPCAMIVENRHAQSWSYYVRNLAEERSVLVMSFEDGEDSWAASLANLLSRHELSQKTGDHVPDPAVLHSLISGSPDGHTVRAPRATLMIPNTVASSRFDLSIEFACRELDNRRLDDLRVLACGADTIELAAHSLASGASSVLLIAESEALAADCRQALRQYAAAIGRMADAVRVVTLREQLNEPEWNVILLHARVDADPLRQIANAGETISRASTKITPAASILMSSASPGIQSEVHGLFSRAGLTLISNRQKAWARDSDVTFSLWEAKADPPNAAGYSLRDDAS